MGEEKKESASMERQDIEQLLQELGDELEHKRVKDPVQVMITGGAYMVLTVQNRQFTEDIDFFPLNFELSTDPSKQTKAFTMLGELGPDPVFQLWATFKKLQVYLPQLNYILALKLFAGRQKDMDDIQALCQQLGITTRSQAQAILDAYVYPRWQQEYRVALTVKQLFPR
jgi:hypothetical protein